MAVFGKRLSRPAQWLSAGVRNTRRVGKVKIDAYGVFSGILLDGEVISNNLYGLPVFLTCRHGFFASGSWEIPTPPISNEILSRCHIIFEGMFDDPANSVIVRFANVLADS